VQVIEFTTSHIDEIDALADEMRSKEGTATVHRGMFTADRDRKNHYLSIIEFDSPQAAIDNVHRPETAEFATKMAALCELIIPKRTRHAHRVTASFPRPSRWIRDKVIYVKP
jgi:hypothetical protein